MVDDDHTRRWAQLHGNTERVRKHMHVSAKVRERAFQEFPKPQKSKQLELIDRAYELERNTPEAKEREAKARETKAREAKAREERIHKRWPLPEKIREAREREVKTPEMRARERAGFK